MRENVSLNLRLVGRIVGQYLKEETANEMTELLFKFKLNIWQLTV